MEMIVVKNNVQMIVTEMVNVLMEHVSVMLGSKLLIALRENVYSIVVQMENVQTDFANAMKDTKDQLAIKRSALKDATTEDCVITEHVFA
jgi:hypothetical protein